jgi:hypothetical protein
MDFIQYVGSIGGIAGVLAALIFWSYRNMVTVMRQDRQFMEDRLTDILNDYNNVVKEQSEAMVKHTQVLTELITWLRAKNGSH